MAPAMTLQAAFPQQANDVDRLFQHLLPNGCRGPSAADDMLVQVLARAEPEKEPPVEHERHCRGSLRDDRRVNPHGRTGDGGADP